MTDPPTFRQAMELTVETIRSLAKAITSAPTRNGHTPSATSVAMADLAAEVAQFQGRSDWARPLNDTHTLGAMTLFAAADYAECFADLFDGDRAPVYGHLVLTRGVLESAVVSSWLNDPQIVPVERVKRGLAEQIYSAQELRRLKVAELAANAGARVQWWEGVAISLGWTVTSSRGKPVIDGVERPSVPGGIDNLLRGVAGKIGKVQWGYLSSVTHVTWYGLTQSIIESPQEDAVRGTSVASIGTESQAVNAQALCVLRALRVAGTSRMELMGWADEQWGDLCQRVEEHETTLIRRAIAAIEAKEATPSTLNNLAVD